MGCPQATSENRIFLMTAYFGAVSSIVRDIYFT